MMSYSEYSKTTWCQFQLKLSGAQKKEEREWQRARLIAYTIYSTSVESSSRVEVWEFYPLPSDPNEKERKKIVKGGLKKQDAKEQREAKKLIRLYQQNGYLKEVNVNNGRRS